MYNRQEDDHGGLLMDWIHRITVAALSTLVLITGWMLVQHEMTRREAAASLPDTAQLLKRHYDRIIADNARIYAEVIRLQEAGDYQDALDKLEELSRSSGNSAWGYILEARLENKIGHLARAIHAYRRAVEKDPDYVDKNTPLFAGSEIMDIITLSRGKLNRERKLRPGDQTIKTAINDIYYLQRRIAGGCE